MKRSVSSCWSLICLKRLNFMTAVSVSPVRDWLWLREARVQARCYLYTLSASEHRLHRTLLQVQLSALPRGFRLYYLLRLFTWSMIFSPTLLTFVLQDVRCPQFIRSLFDHYQLDTLTIKWVKKLGTNQEIWDWIKWQFKKFQCDYDHLTNCFRGNILPGLLN